MVRYILIGVTFLRGGMFVAIAYTLFVEIALGAIPAVVNEATISCHLRSFFLRGLPEGTLPEEIVGTLGDVGRSALIGS